MRARPFAAALASPSILRFTGPYSLGLNIRHFQLIKGRELFLKNGFVSGFSTNSHSDDGRSPVRRRCPVPFLRITDERLGCLICSNRFPWISRDRKPQVRVTEENEKTQF